MSPLLFALVLASQDAPPPAPEALAPPASAVEAPPAEAPPVPVPPPAASPAPPAPDKKAPPKADSSGKLDGAMLGLVQVAAGCATLCVGFPLGLVPCFGHLALAALVGGVETWVGDTFGATRAPLIWPMLANMGALLAVAAVDFAAYFGLVLGIVGASATSPDLFRSINNLGPVLVLVVYGGLAAVGVLNLIILTATPALVYGFTSVEKAPGDDGSAFPGIMEAADPTGARSGKAGKPQDRGGTIGASRFAMAF